MKQTQIMEELKNLTTEQQLEVVEGALKLIKNNIKDDNIVRRHSDIKRQLSEAADALLPDYTEGGELTIFTALDGEEFSETG